MRLFVAIEIDQAIVDAVAGTIDELKSRIERLAPRARITWATPDRLHITVKFIGNTHEQATHAIRTALAPTLDVPRFDLRVEGMGAFPPKGAPRVFWAGLTAGRNEALDVERHVSSRLGTLVPVEDRPYSPHLTLARVKDPAGLSRAALFEGVSDRHFGTVHVDAITLFESRLSSKGATYVPLLRTALRRRTQPSGSS
jgi:RNA 2',3'-cyclic 3'-phosphodiesterase